MILPIVAFGSGVLREKCKAITKDYPNLMKHALLPLAFANHLLSVEQEDQIITSGKPPKKDGGEK